VTFTVTKQGIPLWVHVPSNVAVLPGIMSEVKLTPCSVVLLLIARRDNRVRCAGKAEVY
jgi:hypothetical protein